MPRRHTISLVTLVLVVAVVLIERALPLMTPPSPSPSPLELLPTPQVLAETNTKQEALVVKVVDGDTLVASVDGQIHRIRVIGLDTPETVDPRKPVECFGKMASARAKELLDQQTVWLEPDPSQGDRDKYDRWLRYVWINNGTEDFGRIMISQGMGHEYTYDEPYTYQELYRQMQEEAHTAGRGLWDPNICP